MINQTASTVLLAKQMLMDLDRGRVTTTVETATMERILRTLVQLGLGDDNSLKHGEAHARAVTGRIGQVAQAMEQRDKARS